MANKVQLPALALTLKEEQEGVSEQPRRRLWVHERSTCLFPDGLFYVRVAVSFVTRVI